MVETVTNWKMYLSSKGSSLLISFKYLNFSREVKNLAYVKFPTFSANIDMP